MFKGIQKKDNVAVPNYRINDELSQKVIDLPDSDMDSSSEEEDVSEEGSLASSSSDEEIHAIAEH